MAELTEMLAREKGMRVVLLGTDDDRAHAMELMRKTAAKPIDAVGQTSISRLISLVKRCNALVTGDSAPMHIAAATGTPFVALFGPTDPERHLPPSRNQPSRNQRVLYKRIKCAPCYRPACPRNIRCMTSIKPVEVFDALMEIIK